MILASKELPALPAGEDQWLAPARLFCSDRSGGVSSGCWATNNLGHHVEDAAAAVRTNRKRLLDLPGLDNVQWLNQIHGTGVIHVQAPSESMPSVDAMWTDRVGVGLAILTADCLPVVVADIEGEVVGAAHAGWRGLCAGVLHELLAALPVSPLRLRAFIGPAIGAQAFEVGPEVVAALKAAGLASCAEPISRRAGKYRVDLAQACAQQLMAMGISSVSGGHWCTYTHERFYSWRRETHRAAAAAETPQTGRQATLVWLPRAGR